MIEISDRRGESCLQPFSRSRVIRTVHENRRILGRVRHYRIGAKKRHSWNEKLQPPRNCVGVHTNHFVTERLQHSRERDLRADAVAVGTSVSDHGDFTSFESLEQLAETRREFGEKCFHVSRGLRIGRWWRSRRGLG